jgi:hypothetical protein
MCIPPPQLAEELERARTTYGALNSQLVDELPVLIQLSTEVHWKN